MIKDTEEEEMVPDNVLLICNLESYRLLIDRIYDCILSFFIKKVAIDDSTFGLFYDIFATPAYAYNHLMYYKLDAFNLHAYHS